ncbi:hypothetical protein RUND412_000642 [Rhizina undulata]
MAPPGTVPESSSSAAQRIPSRARSRSPAVNNGMRDQATVRLGSPVHSHGFPAPGTPTGNTNPYAGPNALAALNFPGAGSPPRFGTPARVGTPVRTGTPPIRMSTPPVNISAGASKAPSIQYGSFDSRQPIEDLEVVRRHLVLDDNASGTGSRFEGNNGGTALDDEFSSLQLQGGDITRPIYRYVEGADGNTARRGRSNSFHLPRPEPEDETLDIGNIKAIGGFRRDYIRRYEGASPSGAGQTDGTEQRKPFLTRNFIEFLTLHGHFAGEDLEEEEDEGTEGWTSDEAMLAEEGSYGRGRDREEAGEESALLGRSHKKPKVVHHGTAGSGKAVLLLLKSFVGTGVLFLPKAYCNGGMLFSNMLLLFVAVLSYYCFVLLVNTRLKVVGSFGDMGGILYGEKMRLTILTSIVISQIGFCAAYIVFTSENLQAFILAVTKGETNIDIKWLILMQLVIFLPLSMIRNMAKLGGTALVADLFIMLGLVYLYYCNGYTVITEGVADIVQFNPKDWTLFVGTAIFTFEGIGLVIPIQETMRHPEKFPRVLAGVMVAITVIFISMGALSYAAYGSQTKTVIILNLPQDDKFVNAVQFLYSLAILLSTPLQLFPAIRIMETGLFPRSGKNNPTVKWQKNIFRFLTVFVTALIAWGGAADLDKFVALIGSFACIPLVYIYPPMLHLKAHNNSTFMKCADVGLCIFGFCVMAYTTTLTIQKWSDPSQ